MDDIDTNLNWVCIKDAELNDISEITPNCKGANEYQINCNGVEKYGYKCENNGTNYIITGLTHSGAMQSETPSSSPYAGHLIAFTLEGAAPSQYNMTSSLTVLPAHTGPSDNCSETNCNRIFMDNGIFNFNITNGTSLLGTMTLNGILMASTAADKVTFTGTTFLWGNATISSLDPGFDYAGNYKVVMEAWAPSSMGGLAILNQTGTSINKTQFVVNMTRILSNNEIIIQNTTQIFVDITEDNKQYSYNATGWEEFKVYDAYETFIYAMSAPYIGLYNRTTTIGMLNISNSTSYWVVDGWGKGWYNQNQSKYYRIFYGYVADEGNVTSSVPCMSDLECDDSNSSTTDVCFDKATPQAACLNGIANVNGTVYDENGNTVADANISFYNASIFNPYNIYNWTNYFENGVIENSTGNYSAIVPKTLPDVITDANGYYEIYLPNTTMWHMLIQGSKKTDFNIDPNNGNAHDTEVFENSSYDPYTDFNVEGHIIHSGQYENDNNYSCGQKVEFVMFGTNKGGSDITISFAVENHSTGGPQTHMRNVCDNQTGLTNGEGKIVYCGNKTNNSENLFIPANTTGNDKVEKYYTFDVPCEFAPEEGQRTKYDIHVYDNLQWGNMHKIGNFFVYGFNRTLINGTNSTNKTNQTNSTVTIVPGLGQIIVTMQNPPLLFTNLTNGNFTLPTELKYAVSMAPAPGSIEAVLYESYSYLFTLEYPAPQPDSDFNVTIVAYKVNSTENYTLLPNGQGINYRPYPPQYPITPYNYSTPNGYYDIMLTAVYLPTGQTANATKRIKVAINEEEANSIAEPVYRDYFGGWLPYDIGDPWRNFNATLVAPSPDVGTIWDRYDDMNNHMGDEYCTPGDCLNNTQITALQNVLNTCTGPEWAIGIDASTAEEYNQSIDNFLHYLKCNCGQTILTGGSVC